MTARKTASTKEFLPHLCLCCETKWVETGRLLCDPCDEYAPKYGLLHSGVSGEGDS